ncbi:MAG: acyl-CoA dehydrogenase [Firmicutes bacterium]|nr:acyl-CoA dehydrogenase [Bacillota bacterium]
MDFSESPEHRQMREMVRDFARREVAPGAAQRDQQEHFDRTLFERMAALGLTGIPWSEKYGGAGADFTSYIIAMEELAKVDASLSVVLGAHVSLCSWPIDRFGTDEQKERFLTPLAEGRALGAFALTEPGAGSDAAHLQTRAQRQGDTYLLNGQKTFITNGGAADTYVVFATVDPSKGAHGVTAFVVEKGMPGFSFGKEIHKMGIRSSTTQELLFENVEVPIANRLGQEGEGFKIAMATLDGGRNGIAAQALGIAEGALEAAIAYAKQREQFGRPIADFQAIQFKLADMATAIEASRLLTYHAVWMEDHGGGHGMASSMAKLFASDTAMQVATQAVQIFGGYGYTVEYPVERFMRDAKITQIYEGTNEIQRIVISRALLK